MVCVCHVAIVPVCTFDGSCPVLNCGQCLVRRESEEGGKRSAAAVAAVTALRADIEASGMTTTRSAAAKALVEAAAAGAKAGKAAGNFVLVGIVDGRKLAAKAGAGSASAIVAAGAGATQPEGSPPVAGTCQGPCGDGWW